MEQLHADNRSFNDALARIVVLEAEIEARRRGDGELSLALHSIAHYWPKLQRAMQAIAGELVVD